MKYRVMLADDEPIMRKALLSLIDWTAIDCEVILTAENGEEVIAGLEKMQPDILITDISMPGKDGIEIARFIWEKQLPVKVIMLTAYADFSFAQAALRYGVSDYVTKTGAFDELIAAIEETKKKIGTEQAPEREENIFKSIFDGSVYDEQDILEKTAGLPFSFESYRILLVQFDKSKKDIRKSVSNFLHMVFQDNSVSIFPLERERFAVVLDGATQDTQGNLQKQCEDILDMMENFAGLRTHVSVSLIHHEAGEIRTAYEEAKEQLFKSKYLEKQGVCFAEEETEDIGITTGRREQILKECTDFIEAHYGDNISVTEMAGRIGVSVGYLSRLIKEETGKTILTLIQEKKVEEAKKYLKTTDMKVYEIADKLGFENTTYFFRFFKKYTGMSPRDFRGET